MFDLFSIHWVQTATIKEAPLGWHDFFIEKRHKKVWRTAPLCIFLDCLEGKKSQVV